MNHRFRSPILLSLVAVAGLAACGGSDGDADDDVTVVPTDAPVVATVTDDTAASETDEAGATVDIDASRFAPTDLSVAPGDTVTFVNNDPFAHTVTSAEGSELTFDSGSFGRDETFEVTFDDAGTYAYFCQIHPTMRATITVG